MQCASDLNDSCPLDSPPKLPTNVQSSGILFVCSVIDPAGVNEITQRTHFVTVITNTIVPGARSDEPALNIFTVLNIFLYDRLSTLKLFYNSRFGARGRRRKQYLTGVNFFKDMNNSRR